jgi:hypothetical protein
MASSTLVAYCNFFHKDNFVCLKAAQKVSLPNTILFNFYSEKIMLYDASLLGQLFNPLNNAITRDGWGV